MLVAFVSILVVGAVTALIAFVVLATTSARSVGRAVAGARTQLMPAVADLAGTARGIAERVQRLRPRA